MIFFYLFLSSLFTIPHFRRHGLPRAVYYFDDTAVADRKHRQLFAQFLSPPLYKMGSPVCVQKKNKDQKWLFGYLINKMYF